MEAVFWKTLSQAVFKEEPTVPDISYCGRLPGPLPVSELLAETVGLVGASLARLVEQAPDTVHVDAQLSAFWGGDLLFFHRLDTSGTLGSVFGHIRMELSRICSGPLRALFALKEMSYGRTT